ncbi:hypothetical protein [Chitinophaga flava]|uniref:Uncharacterized protein n=1 Tax=Chitinophaga flava TaxID=2259036 RepID=A0A365XVL1_9BACT|nr:hypothetical protein [Chitinophaga flava]RBL90051.1 hypothetical protein DF182_26635 [Chitinophaga flava]
MDAKRDLDDIQQHADTFISGSISLYEQTLLPLLADYGYDLASHMNDGKMVELDNDYYPVVYNYYRWSSDKYGTFNWFVLQGSYKYASNIVACLAFPHNPLVPALSMNLNFKLDARTFSIILGFRDNGHLTTDTLSHIREIKENVDSPIYTDTNSNNFLGIRSSFEISASIINKSLENAQRHIQWWFDLQNNSATLPEASYDLYIQQYKSTLINLHEEENTIYDELFGNKWLINLFKNQIL